MAKQSMAQLIRVGVFYDGNYFFHVSNYYAYQHARRARINIKGLHNFMRKKIAELENCEERYCQLVDLHYFRGRLSASEASSRDILYAERTFDDVLLREGITTHYLPLGSEGNEKGIDVWLALEAYELALHKNFDVIALITGDGDYVPLVRKLNTLGTRVAVFSWDYEFRDRFDNLRVTRTSQTLIDEVTYPVSVSQIIEDRAHRNSPEVRYLFVERAAPPVEPPERRPAPPTRPVEDLPEPEYVGEIRALKEGYGFLRHPEFGENLFFWSGELKNSDFSMLREGDVVAFDLGQNDRGPCAINVHLRPNGVPDSPEDFEDYDEDEDEDAIEGDLYEEEEELSSED
jgi:uncharacterized LabA/DUF88 family protein/cold shock CspA family protein